MAARKGHSISPDGGTRRRTISFFEPFLTLPPREIAGRPLCHALEVRLIADATAGFAHLKITASSENQKFDLAPNTAPRDVSVFFTSGFKERNRAAATQLLKRLG